MTVDGNKNPIRFFLKLLAIANKPITVPDWMRPGPAKHVSMSTLIYITNEHNFLLH